MQNQNGKTTKYSLGTSSFSLQLAARYYLLLRDIILKFVCYKVDGLDFLLTTQRIELDLDDGVKVNYGKLGDVLETVKGLNG